MYPTCEFCSREATKLFGLRCEDHYRCDDCGAKDNLVSRTEGVLCDSCFRVRVDKRIATFDGDTDNTGEVTCPYCGYVFDASFEFDNYGEAECPDCENTFHYQRNVWVDYTTKKAE